MIQFSKITKNSKFSETQYYSVHEIKQDGIILKNENGEGIEVTKEYAEQQLVSSDQVNKQVMLTKTEAAEMFIAATNVVLTVCFNKQVKEADVLKEILEAHQNSAPKDIEKAFKATIKKAIQGEERTMVCKHFASKDDFGRVHCTDLEIEKDPSKTYDVRQRLVDPRTILWFILRGIKYIVK